MSVVVETFHPWLTGPSRFAFGTTTSVKKTSLKWWCPVIRTRGRTVMPGVVIGTRRQLIPWCFGTSGFVRTSRMIQCAKCAPDVHTFWPLTTKWSPWSMARVRRLARSEPAPGSENPWHQISSALRIAGRWRRFCSGVPVDDGRPDQAQPHVPRQHGRAGDGVLLVPDDALDQPGVA